MSWLLHPPLVLGWFESLLYRVGSPGRDSKNRREERLKYWSPGADNRSPKAQLYGFLTGSIVWIAATFMIIIPLLGWLVNKGVPVPAFAFGVLAFLPIVTLVYIGALLSFAPTKSTSKGWILALSWPVEVLAVLLAGLVSWFI